MKRVVKWAMAGALLCSAAVNAQEEAAAGDRPSLSASRTITVGATVAAIDHETRAVTLETPDGERLEFTASPDVRNLAQVEPGDLVLAQLTEEVSIEVFANPEGLEPGSGEFMEAARAEAGALPGGAVSDTFILTAVVEDIDLEQNTFKLRGPEGSVREFAARDPANLRRAQVGDLVVITVTQSVGVMVERPAAEAGGG